MTIQEIIKKDKELKECKYVGREYYYKKQNQKLTDTISVLTADGNIKDITVENKEDLYTNFFKLLVNQKLNYLLAKEPSFNISNYTKTKIVSMMEDMVLSASLDGVTWLHFYYDKKGLNFINVLDKEIIPFYDMFNNLTKLIRYYKIDKDTTFVEIWTNEGKQTLKIKEDKLEEIKSSNHYEIEEKYGEIVETVRGGNFDQIPFIPLKNNKSTLSDIVDIQQLLDMYNSIQSGFIDNVYKFQEALMLLKGFSGDEETLKETMENLKRYKAAGLPQDGDLKYLALEIPVEARRVLLDILKQNIFSIGRGLDIDKVGDGNITNVVIMARYAALDMKSNEVASQLKIFWSDFVEFLNQKDDTIVFNKTMLINEVEAIQNCVQSIPLLSRETILANHPWIVDVPTELELLLKEQELFVDKTTVKNDSADKTATINDSDEENLI